MKFIVLFTLAGLAGMGCGTEGVSSNIARPDPAFASGDAAPAPTPVSVDTNDGQHYQGRASLRVTDDGTTRTAELTILASTKDRTWEAHLFPDVAAVAPGELQFHLKPGAFTPGSGYIDNGAPASGLKVSNSGTMTVRLGSSYQLSGTALADTSDFSASFRGPFEFGCVVPASSAPAQPGAPSPGSPSTGVALVDDRGHLSPFCRSFDSLR